MPADIALLPKAQQMLLHLKDSDATGRALVERIGEFFPQATDFEWLTNPDSKTFLEVFYNEESSTGWLTGDEYNEFWGYAADYSDYLENQDPSQVTFEGRTGLTAFLDPMLVHWETAAQQSATTVDPETIGKVDGYPGWWQGYNSQERVWKYRQSAEKPGDGAEGWLVGAQVNWNEQRAKNIYSTALARHPSLDQAAAWAAIWEAVNKTQADDETIISNVLASQRPPVAQQAPDATDPLPTQFTQDIRAAISPFTDKFMRRLPPDIASNKEARDVAEQRFLKEAARILAARGAGQEG
jgi:hypothetical protein